MTKRFPVLASLMASWMFMSVLAHATVGGSFYYWFVVHKPAGIVAELDLSMIPLVATVANDGGAAQPKKEQEWVLPSKHKFKAPPPPIPKVVETKQEVETKEELASAPACVEPCNTAPTAKLGNGGTDGEGDFISAEEAARKPRWVGNFITSRDYPLMARQEGKDGRVVLSVLIDNTGKVRDVRLLQGGYEALNEVALRKVKNAIFSPAYNHGGKAVSCKVTLPIRFELR